MTSQNGLKESLGPHLPFLRRYGRALTGSQVSGDAFVRASLEALLASPEQLEAENGPRVELFRLFHRVWNSVAQTTDGDRPGWTSATQAVGDILLSELPRGGREALLLTAVEGFTLGEVGVILNRDEDSIRRDIQEARELLAGQMAARVLIIEDEPVIAMHLQDIVEEMGHSVAGIAATHEEALNIERTSAPDLVLADIRLADGSSGVDAIRDILATRNVPVIFITAFPERLLSGKRPEPTYLITKPFEVDTVVTTIGQALMLHRSNLGQDKAIAAGDAT